MANQQLVDYIKSQLAAGVTKVDLLKAIETAGWSAQDTTDAFNVVEGKAPATPTAPAAPTAAKPAAPAQPAAQPIAQPVSQPMQQPIKPAAPMQQPMQPTMPMQQPIVNPVGPTSTIAPNLGGPMRASTMQMNVERGGPKSRTALWATLIVLVFVVAVGAAAYFFLPQIQQILGYYLGGQPPVTPVVDQTPIVPVAQEPIATTTATTTPTTPVATSTVTTTTKVKAKTGSSTVASTTASTTLKH